MDQQKYGLLKHISNTNKLEEKLFNAVKEFENNDTSGAYRKMLSERLDLTAFLKWFIQSYPESVGAWKSMDKNLVDFQ